MLTSCDTGYSLSYRQATTISALPDDILLDIFGFYKETDDIPHRVWNWHILVHVCRRWRQVIFGSPLRLNLRVFCTSRTPVENNLGIWPTLPLSIDFDYYSNWREGSNASSEDNVISALKHLDRVCDVGLSVTCSELEKISAVMREPFPVLTSLYIRSKDGNAPALPADFLGGSAPCLCDIHLRRIPFPALPTLLLSTSDLVELHLYHIPPNGYISPEAIVVGLGALPRLNSFIIRFQSTTPRPDRIHPHLVTRTVLPALTVFQFKGASEYLEDLVSRIDAPQLSRIYILYFNQLVDFQVAQLPMFMGRSLGTKLTQFRHAQVSFHRGLVTFNTSPHANNPYPNPPYAIATVLCEGIGWQVSHMAQVLSHFSSTQFNLVHLKLELEENCQLEGVDDVEWLHLLRQFSAVQTLCVSHELAGHVALALENIAWETDAEALPSLALIYLAGQPALSIEKFIAARQVSGRPMTVVETKMEFDEKLESYISK